MRRTVSKTHWDDPAALENEIQRRLRRAKAKTFMYDFLFFLLAAAVVFIMA